MKSKYLTAADIAQWRRDKRADWLRDKKLVEEGKLRPEDLSWAHRFGWGKGKVIFTTATAGAKNGIASTDD